MESGFGRATKETLSGAAVTVSGDSNRKASADNAINDRIRLKTVCTMVNSFLVSQKLVC
jgi:hypothetical protein